MWSIPLEIKNSFKKLKMALEARSPEVGWANQDILSHVQKGQPWVATFSGHELQAFILYTEAGRVIEVVYMETLKCHRGKGVMFQLFSRLLNHNSQKTFWLDVHEQNSTARRLYDKLGFKNNGLRKGYYRDGGDCLLLERSAAI